MVGVDLWVPRNCTHFRREPWHLLRKKISRSEKPSERLIGGPTRIRTWNQGIRVVQRFPSGADYLFTLRVLRAGGVRDARACYEGR